MTEDEWRTSLSPVAMLRHLKADGGTRKSLLYAAAVCLRVPELLTDGLRKWVDRVEARISGVPPEDTRDLRDLIDDEPVYLAQYGPVGTRAQYTAIAEVTFRVWEHARYNDIERHAFVTLEELEPVQRANADLVRDIFGNPFRPTSFAPAWRTDTATAIARQMYESRDFGAMPILADALQDAGCDAEEVLAHCRDPHQVHVRGCWVVDLVLGYE